MTTEETALADKLLKEATDTTDTITRRERIEDYQVLLNASCARQSASTPYPDRCLGTAMQSAPIRAAE